MARRNPGIYFVSSFEHDFATQSEPVYATAASVPRSKTGSPLLIRRPAVELVTRPKSAIPHHVSRTSRSTINQRVGEDGPSAQGCGQVAARALTGLRPPANYVGL